MQGFDKNYWNDRYAKGLTQWDIGEISTPLKTYFRQLTLKTAEILIPGAGNAYEAEYLWEKGFINVYVLEISELAITNFRRRVPEFPASQIVNTDFFEYTGSYDLIVEQTFFCAIPVAKRPDYAKKVHELLKPGGRLVGLLFDFPLTKDGPPFGGSKEEYIQYFEPYFNIITLERAYNSIAPRQGTELFIILEKPGK